MAPELDPPFDEPLWYRRHRRLHPHPLHYMRRPGKMCFVHDNCEQIEHDLLLLAHPEGLPPELEDNFQIRTIQRLIKMSEPSYEERETEAEAVAAEEEKIRRGRKPEERVEEKTRGEGGGGGGRRRKRKPEESSEEEEEEEEAVVAAEAETVAAELEHKTHIVQDPDYLNPSPVWNIQAGKKLNVLSLLSRRRKRNYLIKIIKGKGKETEEVTIDELKTKYVLLLFWFLSDDGVGPHENHPDFMADLEDMYSAYTGEFEVVFVAFGTNEDAFHAIFSRMPWLAIPHQDQQGRDLFRTKFAIPYCPGLAKSVLFDPNGRVLLDYPEEDISSFGVHCFPFTKERMEEVASSEIREADALLDEIVLKKEEPPLTTLLGYNIITSEGNQVSTSVLEGKTVGLYYLENSAKGCQRTRKVLKIWKSLKDVPDKDLEIVFVNEDYTNLSYARAIYKDNFGSPMLGTHYYPLIVVSCPRFSGTTGGLD